MKILLCRIFRSCHLTPIKLEYGERIFGNSDTTSFEVLNEDLACLQIPRAGKIIQNISDAPRRQHESFPLGAKGAQRCTCADSP